MRDHDWAQCPRQDYLPQLRGYWEQGVPLGNFLTKLLSNDLFGAVTGADEVNALLLPRWVRWLYNDFDSRAWGSPEKVNRWLAHGGLAGRAEYLATTRTKMEEGE